jgi:hypothetical protein
VHGKLITYKYTTITHKWINQVSLKKIMFDKSATHNYHYY